MSLQTLTLDREALHIIQGTEVPEDWYRDYTVPSKNSPIFSTTIDNHKYVLARNTNVDAPKMVVNLGSCDLASVPVEYQEQTFHRIVRMALSKIERGVQCPFTWRPFHKGNIFSIQAFPVSSGRGERIVSIVGPEDSNDVYVTEISGEERVYDLDSYEFSLEKYHEAVAGYALAIEAEPDRGYDAEEGFRSAWDLTDVDPTDVSKGWTFSEWYPNRLSHNQKKFVDYPLERSLKLRGAAGTGKTLAMIIKALKTIYDAEDRGEEFRVIYLTHSWSASERVESLVKHIDERDVLGVKTGGEAFLDIWPLTSLADDTVRYDQINMKILGSDSYEGKKRQLSIIADVIRDFVRSDWITYRANCSGWFCDSIEASENTEAAQVFRFLVMIEFGCVLGAMGYFPRSGKDSEYLKMRRRSWMMPLEGQTEKLAILELYRRYLDKLDEEKAFSVDQLINDYINFLNTFYWERARTRLGYDAVFVDEMHLFNEQERLVFHHLLRNRTTSPIVVMALDPKQSPLETFVSVSETEQGADAGIYQRANLGSPEEFKLDRAYRFSTEIADLIKFMDAMWPAMMDRSDEELEELVYENSDPGERKPRAVAFENETSQFQEVFKEASRAVKRGARYSRKVAILCMNEERFERYRYAARGQYSDSLIEVTSREDTENIRYAGKKFVLSLPEYVAGLQFETVYLLDVNDDDVPRGQNAGLQFRQFLSEMYLGISRAQKNLILTSTRDRGGLYELLRTAADENLIKREPE